MKLKNLTYLALTALVLMLNYSCTKSDDSKKTTPTTPSSPTALTGFFYSVDAATDSTKADTSWVNGRYNTIIAQKSSKTIVEINLTALTVGTYNISSSNMLSYDLGTSYWSATGGTVVISKNSDNKLTGYYNVTGTGSVNKVHGSFTDIIIK